MAIDLDARNLEAYMAVKDMLRSKGRAVVIHPTGIGKSFIGFI